MTFNYLGHSISKCHFYCVTCGLGLGHIDRHRGVYRERYERVVGKPPACYRRSPCELRRIQKRHPNSVRITRITKAP